MSLEQSFLHKELHRILMNVFFFRLRQLTHKKQKSTREQNKYVKEISSVAQAAYWLTLQHITLLTDLRGYCSKVKQGSFGNWRQIILPWPSSQFSHSLAALELFLLPQSLEGKSNQIKSQDVMSVTYFQDKEEPKWSLTENKLILHMNKWANWLISPLKKK